MGEDTRWGDPRQGFDVELSELIKRAEPAVLVMPTGRMAFTLQQLVDVIPFSVGTMRKAVRKPRADGLFPPPLAGKRDSKGRVIVLATDLQLWLDSLDGA